MSSDELGPSFRKFIDSTTAITLARFFMPLVVAVLGYFLSTTLSDLKFSNQQIWAQLGKMIDAQAVTNAAAAGVSAKVDAAVKQLDHLQGQVDSLPRR